MSGSEFVHYLTEFYTAEEIRAAWKQAGDAKASRVKTVIHINQSGHDGRNHAGIALATPAEFDAFMASCRAALDIKDGGTGNLASTGGSSADFSQRYVGT